jgi:hypothetical protein
MIQFISSRQFISHNYKHDGNEKSRNLLYMYLVYSKSTLFATYAGTSEDQVLHFYIHHFILNRQGGMTDVGFSNCSICSQCLFEYDHTDFMPAFVKNAQY